MRAEEGTQKAPVTWLFEPESFAPLAKLVGKQRWSIVTDHLGTPISMLDEYGGETWSADVDVYGALRNLNGERAACPFRWPGQYEDVETGLYYNRFRYYDAESGQYVSQDPLSVTYGLRMAEYSRAGELPSLPLLRMGNGSSQYLYALDPLVWTDPFGQVNVLPGAGGDVEIHAYPGPPAGGIEHKPLHVHLRRNGKDQTRVLMEDWVDNGRVKGLKGEVYPGDPAMTKQQRKTVNKNLDTLASRTKQVFETGKWC